MHTGRQLKYLGKQNQATANIKKKKLEHIKAASKKDRRPHESRFNKY